LSEFPINSVNGQEMLQQLPALYEPILEIRVLNQAEGKMFDQLQEDLTDLLNQRCVSTATWDLDNWEEELGIVPPAGQPVEQRRSVVRSKMIGYGKFTGRLLKGVAEAYDNGSIDVSFNPPSSTFTVRFVSTLGAPPNIGDLKRAIDEIIPSHLVIVYQYKYLLVNQIHGVMTINELQTRKLSDFSPVLPALGE
jgi:hypothetical protein